MISQGRSIYLKIKNNMNLDLKNREWKEFPVKSLFNIERGKRLIIRNRISGNIPFVTAGFQNQGVAELIQNKEQKSFSNSITIDMFGNVFYNTTSNVMIIYIPLTQTLTKILGIL